MPFELPKLKYAYSALEPNIDAKTMEIHHSKHHNGYTSKLNLAVEGTPMENKSIDDILKSLDMSNSALRNNAGGYYNHNLFWEVIGPNCGGAPTEIIANAINKAFGSYEEFKKSFTIAATTRFGSGWAWLCADSNGNLEICSTANQDNPLMPGQCGKTPILCIDVWEHAYYLNYQNRRPDYINSFFDIINWNEVEKRFKEVT